MGLVINRVYSGYVHHKRAGVVKQAPSPPSLAQIKKLENADKGDGRIKDEAAEIDTVRTMMVSRHLDKMVA